ncbi:hypothetical protein QE450_000880 [Paenibacillus sp. SORGH_AS306]|nr:hypothetical protein [Paenibacillus sp. SORGH_AS_0306]MDR6110422.1 hypothetical protein [Paenibacillus sp. SORGH_AS_0338]
MLGGGMVIRSVKEMILTIAVKDWILESLL